MNIINKTIKILPEKELKHGRSVLLMVIGMAIFDAAGIASLMPFLALLGNPQLLESDPILSNIFSLTKDYGIQTSNDFLICLGIVVFLIITLTSLYRILTIHFMNGFVEMCRYSISSRLLKTYLNQPYAFFLNRHSSDMSKNILSEVDQLIGVVIRPVFFMFANILVLIAVTMLILIVNFWLGIFTAIIIGGLYALIFLFIKHKLLLLGEKRVECNKGRFKAAAEAFAGIKEIKLKGCEEVYLNRFKHHVKGFAATIATQQTINHVPKYLVEAVAFGGLIIITLITMISADVPSANLGQVLPIVGLYAVAAYRVQPLIQVVFQGFVGLRNGKAAVDKLYEDLFSLKASQEWPNSMSERLNIQSNIGLRNLTFTYPIAKKPTLTDINIVIPKGSSLGIIGATGSGKTTLVDLLLGLLSSSKGEICIDDLPVLNDQLSSWQQSLGYVPQEIYINDVNIYENIAFGVPTKSIKHNQVILCAKLAQVHDFIINELPDKYETILGERGVRLSGGQRQRIGIARALYHNPEVLVFDEATSALDTFTEQVVMDAIEKLSGQKTIILIAHRLNTVRNCEKILYLDNGMIRATGTFKEIMKHNPQLKQQVG